MASNAAKFTDIIFMQCTFIFFFHSWTRNGKDQFNGKAGSGLEARSVKFKSNHITS